MRRGLGRPCLGPDTGEVTGSVLATAGGSSSPLSKIDKTEVTVPRSVALERTAQRVFAPSLDLGAEIGIPRMS